MDFYENADLSGKKTGIKFYSPKPYLLVARTENKEKPVDVQVIYLPDLAKPMYAAPRAGLGSADISVALQNGMLTSFGAKSDSRIPEMLAALGGLDQAIATASKTRRERDLLAEQAADSETLDAAAAQLAGIQSDLARTATKTNELTTQEIRTLHSADAKLAENISILTGPAAEQSLAQVLKGLTAVSKSLGDVSIGRDAIPRTTAGDEVKRAKDELDKVIANISPQEQEPPVFVLYEIDNSAGTTRLKQVDF